MKSDFLIIGAGLAGLTKALQIIHKYPDYQVTLLDSRNEVAKNSLYKCTGEHSYYGKIYLEPDDLNGINNVLYRFNQEKINGFPIKSASFYYWNHYYSSMFPVFKEDLNARGIWLQAKKIRDTLAQCKSSIEKNEKIRNIRRILKLGGTHAQKYLDLRDFFNTFLAVYDFFNLPLPMIEKALRYLLVEEDLLMVDLEKSSLIPLFTRLIKQSGGEIILNSQIEEIFFKEDKINGLRIGDKTIDVGECCYTGSMHDLFGVVPKASCPENLIRVIDKTSPVAALVLNIILTDMIEDLPEHIVFPNLSLQLEIRPLETRLLSNSSSYEEQSESKKLLTFYSYFHEDLSNQKNEIAKMMRNVRKALVKIGLVNNLKDLNEEKVMAFSSFFSRSYESKEMKYYLRNGQVEGISNFSLYGEGIGENFMWNRNIFSSID